MTNSNGLGGHESRFAVLVFRVYIKTPHALRPPQKPCRAPSFSPVVISRTSAWLRALARGDESDLSELYVGETNLDRCMRLGTKAAKKCGLIRSGWDEE